MRESGVIAPRQFAGLNEHVRWRAESMADSGMGVVRGMRGAALSWCMGRILPVFGSVRRQEGGEEKTNFDAWKSQTKSKGDFIFRLDMTIRNQFVNTTSSFELMVFYS